MIPGMGGRGMNPRQLQRMMKQLGIDVREIEDVEEVVVRTATKEYVFHDAEVTVMDAQGSTTWQIAGEAEERPVGEPADRFPREDVELVMDQAGVSEEKALAALEASDGRPADAILSILDA